MHTEEKIRLSEIGTIFRYGMRMHEIHSGKPPTVCILSISDYSKLKWLASEECSMVDMNITRYDSEITYLGVKCFVSALHEHIPMFGE